MKSFRGVEFCFFFLGGGGTKGRSTFLGPGFSLRDNLGSMF